MQNTNVQTFQTWAVVSDEITNNGIMTLSLPATLANSMLAFEFYNGDIPITTNTTSGSLAITGKYKNGRNRSVATIDLANVNEYPVLGLYNSLTLSLTNLVGCNRVVVHAVQYVNIVPSGADGGATSLVVTSSNSSVAQMGASTYDAALKKLTVDLEAVGDGGMANPMTSAADLIYGGTPVGGVAPPVRLQKGTVGQILTSQTTGIAWMDNPAFYLYTRYRYVDNVGGLDTNNGSYNAPYKTMKYSVENNPTGTIHVLMGQSAEAAFSIPADKTNIDIIAQGTRSALNGFTNKVTVLTTGYGSVRFQDLNFGGGLTRAATCTCGIYVYDGSIGSAGFTNSGNGYTEISQTDASNGVNNISAGTTVFYGGKVSAPSITGAGTVVTFDNVGTVNGNAAIAASGITLYMFETNWAAAASGHAITCVAGTVVTMQGCNFVRPNGTLASIKVDNYDIQNTDFDRANSVLGTHIGNVDWYAKLGLLNADTITTATKMLVRKATGEIAEQLIPTFNIPIQFNAPVSSLYSPDLTPTPLLLKSSAGSSQTTQMVQLCTVPGSITLDQLFNATIASGKTLTYTGRLVVYNALTATNANYYINIQMIGVVGSTGQLVNLGDIVTTQLSKVQYAYTPVNISGTYTNPSGTAIEAIGIRAQLLYGEANGTALVDTFFLQGTIT